MGYHIMKPEQRKMTITKSGCTYVVSTLQLCVGPRLRLSRQSINYPDLSRCVIEPSLCLSTSRNLVKVSLLLFRPWHERTLFVRVQKLITFQSRSQNLSEGLVPRLCFKATIGLVGSGFNLGCCLGNGAYAHIIIDQQGQRFARNSHQTHNWSLRRDVMSSRLAV